MKKTAKLLLIKLEFLLAAKINFQLAKVTSDALDLDGNPQVGNTAK